MVRQQPQRQAVDRQVDQGQLDQPAGQLVNQRVGQRRRLQAGKGGGQRWDERGGHEALKQRPRGGWQAAMKQAARLVVRQVARQVRR